MARAGRRRLPGGVMLCGAACYHRGWARGGKIRSDQQRFEIPLILDHAGGGKSSVGPLFWSHYSYLGLDPRRLSDRYANYWEVNRNHARIHYAHCVKIPLKHAGYGEDCWSLRMPGIGTLTRGGKTISAVTIKDGKAAKFADASGSILRVEKSNKLFMVNNGLPAVVSGGRTNRSTVFAPAGRHGDSQQFLDSRA